MKKLIAAAVTAVGLLALSGGAASAAVRVIDFTLHERKWFQAAGSELPYGVGAPSTLTAQILLDDSIVGPSRLIPTLDGPPQYFPTFEIVGVTLTTPDRTFTLADLLPGSIAALSSTGPQWISLSLGSASFSWSIGGSGVSLNDGTNLAACRNCLSYIESINGVETSRGNPWGSAVPEPATWAMMIAGFGLVGASLRSRRGLAVA